MERDKDILIELCQLFGTHQNATDDPDSKVVESLLQDELREKFDFSISDDGCSYNELIKAIESYLKLSVKTNHEQFFNQLFGGNNMPALMGDITASFTNTSMYTYEMSPLATLMEVDLIEKMCGYVGYEDGDGILTSGGSISNLKAMMCARNRAFPEIGEKGLSGLPKMSVFISENAHYSLIKAANILGIGMEQVKYVKSDTSGSMIPNELERMIKLSLANGERPFFIGLTMGTTLLGAFDPAKDILPIAKKYGQWMHCDGSWGGSVILSNKYKFLLEGIDEADSFTWNPHKLMNIPLTCSALLLKENGHLEKNFSVPSADYIFHNHDYQNFDLGKKSIQCGRKVDSLKLWLAWKFHGNKGYENKINRLFELSSYAQDKIMSEDLLELCAPVQSLNICFRYMPEQKAHNVDQFNIELRNRLITTGRSMINYGNYKGNTVLRLVLPHSDIQESDIDSLIQNILDTAQEMSMEYNNNDFNLEQLVYD